jgi:hydroxysqualene dehydroxylase
VAVGKTLAIVGAGWAGCAAAVAACRAGHQVTLFEASHHAGGRARKIENTSGVSCLDNGQHILIGAYTETLALMQSLGVDMNAAFVRSPLQLLDVQGIGLQLSPSALPPGVLVAAGILRNRAWLWRERWALLQKAVGWQLRGFACPSDWTVERLCQGLPRAVMQGMIEPLCVSALNTPADRASASVFLRVLHDALFAVRGGSDLLIPQVDLSALLPEPALAWLREQDADVRLGERVTHVAQTERGWQVNQGSAFDALILALPHKGAAQLLRSLDSPHTADWLQSAGALQDEAIATVYVQAHTEQGAAHLSRPMLRLRGEPVQFVFDRGQLGNAAGTLALVASAPGSQWSDNAALTQAALAQAQIELAGLGVQRLTHLQTVVEKRATFACTPLLHKPPSRVSPALQNLWVCGDYVDGPYPATLEAAVRSGLAAAQMLQA